jgi:hypothetical protein
MRVLIVRASASLAPLPFRDGWVLVGLTAVGGTSLWVESQGPIAEIRFLVGTGFAIAAFALTHPQWRMILNPYRRMALATGRHT